MSYQKPTCHCGGELFLVELVASKVEYQINKNGKKSKRPFSKSAQADVVTGEQLRCGECNYRYDVTWDDKDRLIKVT